jgi:REP element-mobilizing transposase RayT
VYCLAVARQPRLEFENALYHVIVRGLERRSIFRDDEDRQAYLDRLADLPARHGVRISAFCLMSNHVHLAVQTGRAPLSRVMGQLQTAYAVSFNRRHDRVGPVFQGRYRALLVERDTHLLALVRYVHLNPVRAGLVSRPEDFPWSSHPLYLKGGARWLASDEVLGMLGSSKATARRAFERFVNGSSASEYDPDGATADSVLGGERFVRRSLRSAGREDLWLRSLRLESVAQEVAAREGVEPAAMAGPGRARALSRARTLCALVARDLASIPVARTARFFRRDPSTVSRDLSRMDRELASNPSARDGVERLKAALAKRPSAK